VFRDRKEFACALDALKRCDFARADAELTVLLLRAGLPGPERAFLQNKRGVARIGLERREEARADFLAALEAQPAHAAALTNLGNLLLESGSVADAIAHYQRAIAADDEYAPAYLNLGVAYKKSGRIAEGVRAMRRAQRLEWRASSFRAREWLRRPRSS